MNLIRKHFQAWIALSLFSVLFILSRWWMIQIFPHPEVEADAYSYFSITRDILNGQWPSFFVRGPGYPLFQVFVMLFSKSFYAIVLAHIFFAWLSSCCFIFTWSLWHKNSSIPIAIVLSFFLSLNAVVQQEIMLYSDSFYTSFGLITLAALILCLKRPTATTAIAFSLCSGYLIWTRMAAIYILVIVVLVLIHATFKAWPKKVRLGLCLPLGTMLLSLNIYNGLKDDSFSLSPWSGVVRLGPGFTDWQTHESYPDHVNESILKGKSKFDPKDLATIRSSWDPIPVWQAYQNNWPRCRYGSFNFSIKEDQKHFKHLGNRAILSNPQAYLKFVYIMSYMHFFFYPTEDTECHSPNLFHFELKVQQAIDRNDEYSPFYKKLYSPTRLSSFDQQPLWGIFNPYHHYLQAYLVINPWIRNAFWPWFWLACTLFAMFRCLKCKLKDVDILCATILLIAPLGAGLLVAAVEVSVLRYSYPLEFIYLLSPFLLWTCLPHSWKAWSPVRKTMQLIAQPQSKALTWSALSLAGLVIFYGAVQYSLKSYNIPHDTVRQLALRESIHEPRALLAMSAGLRRQNNPHAIDAALLADEVMPNHIAPYFELMLSYKRNGQEEEAQQAYEKILHAPARTPEDIFFIGQALVLYQRKSDAIKVYINARQHFPDFHPKQFQRLTPQQTEAWDQVFQNPPQL